MAHPTRSCLQGFDTFSKGDLDTLRDLFDPDAVWHAPGRSPPLG
jgi:ketosteroid isomerase-like protein